MKSANFAKKLFISFFFLFIFSGLLGFRINNQLPFFLVFGVPSQESPRIESQISLTSDLAHNNISKREGSNILFIRGETYTFNFIYDYALSENWQFGFELPFILQRSANLQGVIDEYHHLLGLDNIANQKGKLGFYLWLPDDSCFLNKENEAFGDLLLKFKRNIYRSRGFLASALVYWKLPTGKRGVFTGSGSQDYSVAFSFAHLREKFGFDHFWSYTYLGDFATFDEYQRKSLYTANFGLDYFCTSKLTLRVQLNGSSAYYQNTDFAVLDDGSLQLLAGVKYLRNNWKWQFFVGEDVWVDHSPDVSFSLVTGYLF